MENPMQVNASTPAQAPSNVARESQEPAVGADSRRANAGADTQDTVVISAAGRAKAAAAGQTLTPDRARALRQAILDGKLDSVDVLSNTARRILARGDA
jgi:anti-sigma28 factor (negative regulator of flagellin synthesis)